MASKNYQNVLFDWDGCLARSLEAWIIAVRQAYVDKNIFPSEKEFKEKIFSNLESATEYGLDYKEFYKTISSMVDKEYADIPLFPGAEEILTYLKDKQKNLVLVTSTDKNKINRALDKKGIRKYFDIFLTQESVKNHKPDPEIIDLALAKLNAKKEETVIIGDSTSDLGAAKNAKIDSVLFYPKEHEDFYIWENLKKYNPTYIIKNLIELKRIIN
jgi:pyrophosphatase PpaX